LCTTCFIAIDVLPAKLESPPYTALIEFVPTVRIEIANPAARFLSIAVSNKVAPFMNEMLSPFGGAPMLEVTIAVKVTVSPYVDGFGEDLSVVVVAARTNWLTGADVLPLLFESPS
jgi:hypothetical protein